MTIKECYEQFEGDYEDAMERFGSDALIDRFMLKFPNNGPEYMTEFMNAFQDGDVESAFKAAHTLKGIAANLSFERFRKAADVVTEQLRPLVDNAQPDAVEELEKSYQLLMEKLQQYQNEKEL